MEEANEYRKQEIISRHPSSKRLPMADEEINSRFGQIAEQYELEEAFCINESLQDQVAESNKWNKVYAGLALTAIVISGVIAINKLRNS